MANKYMDTDLLDKALVFAIEAHAGQERRGHGFPYIIHPMEAVCIVATMTTDQELLAAAALHDVVEDCDVSIETIREEFGDRVAHLVANESDEKMAGSDEDTWHMRKQAAIDRLAASDFDSKMVALGDKLSNIRQISADYRKQGDSFWSKFHVTDPRDHEWYYRGLVQSLSELEGYSAYQEFASIVDATFKAACK